MILVISLDPCVDRWYYINDFKVNRSFRAEDFRYTPGGKGISVAKVINEFNEPVMVTGFIGGEGGRLVENGLDDIGITHKFIHINDETQNTIRIIGDNGSLTEIIEETPSISADEVIRFYELFKELVKGSDVICACGDVPKGIPSEIYRDLILIAKEYNKKVFLDTSGEALKLGIKAVPYFVKPNKEELEYYLGCSIESHLELIQAGKYLSDDGIQIVVISLGEDGAYVFNEGYIYRIMVPKVDVINSIGSGASMVGGFIAGVARNYDFEFTLKLAAACGTANAIETEPGMINMANMKKIMNDVVITKSRF